MAYQSVQRAIDWPFHGGDTGSNPVGDANLSKTLANSTKTQSPVCLPATGMDVGEVVWMAVDGEFAGRIAIRRNSQAGTSPTDGLDIVARLKDRP